jgi:glyoxylase-like metal-dependent hydrolase (beta-lactamase superfamily II)
MATGITVRAVVASRFALDGGAMHGIVPRLLWERVHPPDDKHRIALVARLLVVERSSSGARTLIELGMGQRWSAKERGLYALAEGADVPGVLAESGIDPDTITHVVLTHAHWDHAGGLVRGSWSEDEPELAFPRAEHVIGELCLAHAQRPVAKDAGSFRADDIALLLRRGKVRTWREGDPVAPGIEGRLSEGHTEGLLIPMIPARDDGPPLAVPTDLIPTRSHLKPHWVMAYDNLPATSVAEKRALIDDLGKIGGGIALYHDPLVEAAWTATGPQGVELRPGPLGGLPAPAA